MQTKEKIRKINNYLEQNNLKHEVLIKKISEDNWIIISPDLFDYTKQNVPYTLDSYLNEIEQIQRYRCLANRLSEKLMLQNISI